MKKLNLAKNILFVIATSLLVIFSIVMWAQSFDNSKWESSSKIKFSEEYVVYLVISISFLVLSIYNLYVDLKGISFNKNVGYGSLLAATGVFSLYKLTLFFNEVFDPYREGAFDFKANQINLYLGLVSLVLLAYIIVAFIQNTKKNNQ